MPSFGENLRRERERRKITLDQISQSTKIGTRMLQALEEDKFSQLPGGIFNKGFVRSYARCVGLDEEQAIAEYLQASGDSPPVLPETPPEHHAPRIVEAANDTPQRPLPWGLFAALLLVAALALSLWSNRQKKEHAVPPQPATIQSQPEASPPPPSASTATTVAPAPTASAPATTGPAKSSSPAAQPQNLPQQPQASQPPASQQSKIVPAKPPAVAPVTTTPAANAPAAAAGFVIKIQAREDCWLHVTSDDKPVYSGNLIAGDERSIRAQNQVVVRTGNAGGVDLSFNGKKVPTPGAYGEVRTITFGPNGIIASNPAAPTPQ